MQVRTFTVGNFQVNTYLVTDLATGASAVVDTGETDELVRRLRALDPQPDIRMILLTHAHLDHAGALPLLQQAYDVPTYMCGRERPVLESIPMQARLYGIPLPPVVGRIDHEVDDGDTVQLGETTLRFLATPGHTPGQGCWYDDTDILVGDTLFAGSIGRTDFPLSNPADMVESLRRLMALPGHLRVWSGHGPMTTLDHELRTNPFLGYIRRERGISGPPGFRWAPGT
ncbi:MAG: MBL fold metallo-hydrolase [Deltaproteobacteria bacterium]|nr:MAG: MBL fold metallo-hydrolase [Deltaproteobacteria bacterium]